MLQILIPNRARFVNFSNPLNGRLWLAQLEAHERYGLLFKPDLDLPRQVLGFTFRSNKYGTRGPANAGAPGVVLGTSFAMGLSVDNGDNWYDYLLDSTQWFNIAMPTGPANHLALLTDRYTGSGEVLLYLYHPNLWKTATGFVKARAANRTIFQQLGWRSDRFSALQSYLRWVPNEFAKIVFKQSFYRRWGGRTFHFNPRYNYLDIGRNRAFVEAQMTLLNDIYSRFRQVIVVRAPIKEELGIPAGAVARIDRLRENYEQLWQFFCDNVSCNVMAVRMEPSHFGPEDFHPYDTHWTAAGNRKFAKLLHGLLLDAGVSGLADPYV